MNKLEELQNAVPPQQPRNGKNRRLYSLQKKSPFIAFIFSLLIVGTGSMYAGKMAHGVILLLFAVASGSICLLPLMLIIWIMSPMIAYSDVKTQNKILRLELGL